LRPLGSDPRSQLGVFDVVARNIAVSVDNAIVGKFAQTVFPGGDPDFPFETKAFQFLDSERVIGELFPFPCNLY
jgi:hypothetical protein